MITPTLRDVIEMATVMKEAARAEIMPRFGNIREEEKYTHGRESVTAADREASRYILERRRAIRPGSFSEEELDDCRFLYDEVEEYDPVDGTDEFIAGMRTGFAMHGALLRRFEKEGGYRPVGGVIYLPGTDTLWYAEEGGALHYEESGRMKQLPLLPDHKVLGWVRELDIYNNGYRYLGGKKIPLIPFMETYYATLAKHLELEAEIVPGGGSGASFSDLLSGKTNLILLPWDDSKDWDLPMAEPLVHARGGFICDFAGNEYTYNRRDVLNRGGYVASIVFKKEEILPHLSLEMVMTKEAPRSL